MIRYRLQCARGHQFESWFANGAAYDSLAERGQLACATCGTSAIEKAPMAPRLGRSAAPSVDEDSGASQPMPPVEAGEPDTRPLAGGQTVRHALRKLRAQIIAKADYVGPRFAAEARRIDASDAPSRGIYGEATPEDARALIEDGIAIWPLPPRLEDAN
jgi:hypothetical protein